MTTPKIVQYFCQNETQADIKTFRKWALRNGFSVSRTYKDESRRRAFTLTCGPYSAMCFNRVTLPKNADNPNGHQREDGAILTGCHISVFRNGSNLGQVGITWKKFMKHWNSYATA